MIEIAARLDESAAALAHLGAVDRQLAVDVQRGWRAEARTVQHCRPEQTVEIDDVLADEVMQFGAQRPCTIGVDAALGCCALLRSEERRGGQEGGSTCRSRWMPYH